MPESANINFTRELLSVSLSKLANTVGVIILIIVLNSQFTINKVGIFFFFYILINFLSNFVEGIGRAIEKRVSENKGKVSEYLVVGIIISIIFQLFVAGLILVIYTQLPSHLMPETIKKATITLVISSLILLFAQSFAKLMLNYNSGMGNPGRSEWLGRALPGLLFFIITLAVLYLEFGLPSIFIAGAVSYSFSSVLMFVSTKPDILQIPKKQHFKSISVFSKWSILERVSSNIYNSADVLILGLLVTSVSVGYYESTNNLVNLAYVIPYGIFSVNCVKVSGLKSEGRLEEIYELIKDSIIISSIVPVMLFFTFLTFGIPILEIIFGQQYIQAYWYLVGLALLEILTSYRVPLEGINNGTDNPQYPFYANIGGIITNFTTVLPLIFIFGGIGVVVSTLLAAVVRLGLTLWFTRKYLRDITINIKILTPYIVGIVLSALVYITSFVNIFRMLHIKYLILIFLFIYLISMYLIFDYKISIPFRN